MKILHNASLYNHNPLQAAHTAVCIDQGMIFATGTDQEILSSFCGKAELFDLQGGTVWPGLCDSHLHLQYLSGSLKAIDCETDSLQQCLQNVAQRAATTPAGEWLKGHGWNHNRWQDNAYSNAVQLDAVSGDHPAFLTSKSLHASWANTQALQLAHITAETSDPPGGHIQRDVNGMPTGILLESASELVSAIIPEPTPQQLAEDFLILQQHLFEVGITAVHDFDGILAYEALQFLHANNQLKLRVLKNMPYHSLPEMDTHQLSGGDGDLTLKMGASKLFADGALGPQTAAMIDPYENSSASGILLLSADDIEAMGIKALKSGWGLAVHAIGDRANREVIDGFARIRHYQQQRHLAMLPLRIEHVQCITTIDQARLKDLHITASVQPLHCPSDMHIVDEHWGARGELAYPFASLLEQGVFMIFGSDAPVESYNPFFGLHAAVTRRRHDGTPAEEGWRPQQKLTLAQALAGYTVNPAIQSGMGNLSGQIETGQPADLLVLAVNPFCIPPQELYTITPQMTMISGEIVFSR